ncbi:matrixin family metalloprotease [Candidatus Woesearchaeota archaeon]|nr:matrixin family metalloprotease [Candidatus Woesearchaeota archaeon]
MKQILSCLIVLILSAVIVAAAKPAELPANAKEIRPGVFYLGKVMDNGKVVEGMAFVRYKGNAKPATNPVQGYCGDGTCGKKENADNCPQDCATEPPEPQVLDTTADPESVGNPACYSFLGAKWDTVEPYMVKADNSAGLDPAVVKQALAHAVGEWNSHAGRIVLGSEVSGNVDRIDTARPDGKNEVIFGNVKSRGAIAITITWATSFSGGQIIEWDQLYDQNDFGWSFSGDAGKMDFLNIATHELGHSAGMDDIYAEECSLETMYGYADYSETNKRTLAQGDTTGIGILYG